MMTRPFGEMVAAIHTGDPDDSEAMSFREMLVAAYLNLEIAAETIEQHEELLERMQAHCKACHGDPVAAYPFERIRGRIAKRLARLQHRPTPAS